MLNNAACEIWKTYYEVASAAYNAGEIATARLMYQESIQSATHFGLVAEEAMSCHGLGLCFLRQGDENEGQRLLRKAIRLYCSLDPYTFNAHGLSLAVCALADVYIAHARPDRALPLLKMCEKTIDFQAGRCSENWRADSTRGELKPVVGRIAFIYSNHGQGDKAASRLKQLGVFEKVAHF